MKLKRRKKLWQQKSGKIKKLRVATCRKSEGDRLNNFPYQLVMLLFVGGGEVHHQSEHGLKIQSRCLNINLETNMYRETYQPINRQKSVKSFLAK